MKNKGKKTEGLKKLVVEPRKTAALHKAVKHVQEVKAKEESAAKKVKASQMKRGIILLKHIPHGFYEEEMRKYFAQFGRVLRLRLARSKSTGKSKGFAFVEFEFEEVAKIVAEAMDGYLMYERLMKCEVLPSTVNPRNLFSASFTREDNFPKLRARRRVKDVQIKPKSEEEVKKFLEFRLKKLEEQNQKWAALGIKYKYTPPTMNNAA